VCKSRFAQPTQRNIVINFSDAVIGQ